MPFSVFQEYLESLTEEKLIWSARYWALSRASALVDTVAPNWQEALKDELEALIEDIHREREYVWLSRVRRFVSNVRGRMGQRHSYNESLREEALSLWKFIDGLTFGHPLSPVDLAMYFVHCHDSSTWSDEASIRLIREFLNTFSVRSTDPGGLEKPMKNNRLLLRFSIDPDTDEDSAADAIFEVVQALSALHVGLGGSGLKIDDWQPLVHEGAAIEVFS